MTTLLPGSLLAIGLGLGGVVAYQALAPISPIRELSAHAVVAGSARSVSSGVYSPPPEDQFSIIDMRSMFDPARQPAIELQTSGDRSIVPPNITLVGVAIGSRISVALLKKADANAALSVQLGQSIDGWQLVRIAPDFVVFHAGGADYTVELRAAAGLPQPAPHNVPPPAVTGRPGQ